MADKAHASEIVILCSVTLEITLVQATRCALSMLCVFPRLCCFVAA
jgi:hypothetical protein